MKQLFLFVCLMLIPANLWGGEPSEYKNFAKAFGVVQYYSPNPYTSEWTQEDWAYVASYLMYRADTEKISTSELLKPLTAYAWIESEPRGGYAQSKNIDSAYHWAHYGGGGFSKQELLRKGISRKELEKVYSIITNFKVLEKVGGNSPVADSIYSYKLGDGCYLNIVHSLAKENFDSEATEQLLDDAKTAYFSEAMSEPHPRAPAHRNPSAKRHPRLGSVQGIWNAVRHFYPYVRDDWDSKLDEFITLALTDSLELAHYHALHFDILSSMNDGHVALWPNITINKAGMRSFAQNNNIPIEIDEVEGRVYVKNIKKGYKTRLQQFDVIKSVNTVDIEQFIAQKAQSVSAATPAAKRCGALQNLFETAQLSSSTFVIEAQRAHGRVIRDTLVATNGNRYDNRADYTAKKRVRELASGVYLYDAKPLGAKVTKRDIKTLAGAKAIIFDTRNPGTDFVDVLAHLGSVENFKLPINFRLRTTLPFGINATRYDSEIEDLLEPIEPRINAPKMYFLCNWENLSWGETILQIVRANQLGEIIGTQTAGTNGEATRFEFPIFQLTFTGRVEKNHDGSDHFGVGITPDHIVEQSWQSTLIGKDDLIDYALKLINE